MFEVIVNNFQSSWNKIIPNISLSLLSIQSLGFLLSDGLLKTQLFGDNIIAFPTLLFFNKFYPGEVNKNKLRDYLHASLIIFLMFIVQSRFLLIGSVFSFLFAHFLKLYQYLLKSNILKKLYEKFLQKSLKNILICIFLSLIPYYLLLSSINAFAINYLPNVISNYEYIYRLEECIFAKNYAIKFDQEIQNNTLCNLLDEQSFLLLNDPSLMIRLLSDFTSISQLLENPINLIFPFEKLDNTKYLEDISSDLIAYDKNYLRRSHNLIIHLIKNGGIFSLIFFFKIFISYEKILNNRKIRIHPNSGLILFIFCFLSNDILPIIPLILFQIENKDKLSVDLNNKY